MENEEKLTFIKKLKNVIIKNDELYRNIASEIHLNNNAGSTTLGGIITIFIKLVLMGMIIRQVHKMVIDGNPSI